MATSTRWGLVMRTLFVWVHRPILVPDQYGNLALNKNAWASSSASLKNRAFADGSDKTGAMVQDLGVRNFLAVDLEVVKNVGLIRTLLKDGQGDRGNYLISLWTKWRQNYTQ